MDIGNHLGFVYPREKCLNQQVSARGNRRYRRKPPRSGITLRRFAIEKYDPANGATASHKKRTTYLSLVSTSSLGLLLLGAFQTGLFFDSITATDAFLAVGTVSFVTGLRCRLENEITSMDAQRQDILMDMEEIRQETHYLHEELIIMQMIQNER